MRPPDAPSDAPIDLATDRLEASAAQLQAIDQRLTSATAPPPDDLPFTDAPLLYVLELAPSLAMGRTVLTVMHQRRIRGGGTTKPKPIDLSLDDVAWASGVDRRWLSLLVGAPRTDAAAGEAVRPEDIEPGQRRPATFAVPPALAEELLPQIGRLARAWLRGTPAADPVPLTWDDGDPWRLQLRVTDTATHFEVRGDLVRHQARVPLDDPALIVGASLVYVRRTLARLEADHQLAFAPELSRTRQLVVAHERGPQLAWLFARAGVPADVLPPSLHRIDVRRPPTPWLSLRRTATDDTLLGEVAFDYDGTRVRGRGGAAIIFDREHGRVVHRDPEAEDAAIERLGEFALSPAGGEDDAVYVHVGDMVTIARGLMADGWQVQVDETRYRLPGRVHLNVTSGIDWFDLSAMVSYASDLIPLTEILDALRDGTGAITLGDGTVGVLPEEWLQQYAAIASAGTVVGDRIRFSRAQGALVDALLDERESEAEVRVDAAFARVRRELATFSHITALDPAPSFTGTLRPYQREGLGWFAFLRRFGFGGCLADDMGLGKTIMVLALLDARRAAAEAGDEPRRPSLVVVPRSLVGNWIDEASRFTPSLRVLDAAHAHRTFDADTLANHDVVLVTYGTLRRDITDICDVSFDYVVLDEAQTIKNAGTAAAKAARLLKGEHRLALSGTPIENHLGELWSLFEFLNPGVLGRAKVFERAAADSGHDAAHLLSRGLRPFILRRTKAQVATDLPPRTEQTIFCELDTHERALYDGLRRHYRQTLLAKINREGIARSRMHVLEALLRLRQAACHGGLIDPAMQQASSAKFDVLVPRLQELADEGHKTLVFSQFTSLLDLLRPRLDEAKLPYEYLDGKTRNREARVERFQTDPGVPLFLISLKAGGLGLNLTAASYVFLLDPWWNPAVEAQAIDRAHRIGQEREVFAYRLIASDTVEEKVLELQQSKRDLADAVLAADAVGLRHLERDDLELLLS